MEGLEEDLGIEVAVNSTKSVLSKGVSNRMLEDTLRHGFKTNWINKMLWAMKPMETNKIKEINDKMDTNQTKEGKHTVNTSTNRG